MFRRGRIIWPIITSIPKNVFIVGRIYLRKLSLAKGAGLSTQKRTNIVPKQRVFCVTDATLNPF